LAEAGLCKNSRTFRVRGSKTFTQYISERPERASEDEKPKEGKTKRKYHNIKQEIPMNPTIRKLIAKVFVITAAVLAICSTAAPAPPDPNASGNGKITAVIAGTDLTGGGTSGAVTLNLDTTKVPTLAGQNNFTNFQSFSAAEPSYVVQVVNTDTTVPEGAGIQSFADNPNGIGVFGRADNGINARGFRF